MATAGDDGDAGEPTAGGVLFRVTSRSARNFLLNDTMVLAGDGVPAGGDAASAGLVRRAEHPRFAPPADKAEGPQRQATPTERVHQSRVSLRRIRSNLRTFRLLVDPAWGAALRGELAWYTVLLGEARDADLMRQHLALTGPLVVDEADLAPILDVLARELTDANRRCDEARTGERHARLVAEMVRLLDELPLTKKASKPADELLPALLQRSWHDVRGAGRTARKEPSDAHLHKLRIRLKGLRYGCETVAIVEGGPARKTARAAERLQTRLGDLHDAAVAVDWLHALGADRPELAPVTDRLAVAQEAVAAISKKGWRKDLAEIDRRWRRWQH